MRENKDSSLLKILSKDATSFTKARAAPARRSKFAAEYIRVSTDNQTYSAANQKSKIRAYALRRQLEVIKTYEDGAKSGVVITGRPALQQLLSDVLSGKADYSTILVYDVSRWGRFIDQDEAGCYEFLCRACGVTVTYCAELFPEPGNVTSAVMKSLKRAMAAEFSRNLSVFVFDAKARLAQQGYWMGGPPPYALRRAWLPMKGKTIRVLKPGEWKAVRAEHETLVKGPKQEIDIVRRMFSMASRYGLGCNRIAQELNRTGMTNRGTPWSKRMVHKILTSPVYTGTSVWNKYSQKLRGPVVRRERNEWVQREHAFSAIVSTDIFNRVQDGLQRRREERLWSDDEIREQLRHLLRRRSRLSEKLISRTPGMPSCRMLAARFGSLLGAYKLIGYDPPQMVFSRTKALRRTLKLRNELVRTLLVSAPKAILIQGRRPLIKINGLIVSVFLCPSTLCSAGVRWTIIARQQTIREDMALVGLLNPGNDAIQALYLFPRARLEQFQRVGKFDFIFQYAVPVRHISDFEAAITTCRQKSLR